MYFVVFVFAVSLLLTYLEDRGTLKRGLYIGFGVIIVVFSLRYGYGNDYFNYLRNFKEICLYQSLKEAISNQGKEVGWVILNYLLKDIGYQSVIIIVTLFTNISVCYLIKKRVPKGWYVLAVFLYLSCPHMFLLGLSMMRQSVAITFFALAVDAIYDRKYVLTVCYVLLAISFHTSAIIVIPFAVLLIFRNKVKLELIAFFLLLGLIILLFNSDYTAYLYGLIQSNEEVADMYGNYLNREGSEAKSGLGTFIQIYATIPAFLSYKQFGSKEKTLLILYLISLVFIPLSSQMALIKRLSLYFMFFMIILFPMSYKICKKKLVVYSSLFGVVVYYMFALSQFFVSPTYGSAYNKFQTVLF